MGDKKIMAGVLMDEHTSITFMDICEKCNISEETLFEMVEYGLCNPQAAPVQYAHFDEKTLSRIQSACRLQHDLGINLPGVVLILELLDELEKTREELIILQRHVRGEY